LSRGNQVCPVIFDAFANSLRHARVLLSGIYEYEALQAGFPTQSTSGMTFGEAIIFSKLKKIFNFVIWITVFNGKLSYP